MTELSANEVDLSNPFFWGASEEYREAAFAALRRDRPIAFFAEPEVDGIPMGPGYWALTRFDDVRAASRNSKAFVSGRGVNITDMPIEIAEFFGSMIAMDDPRHSRIRGIVNRAFTPKMVADLEGTVRTAALEIIRRAAPSGSCDFVSEIAARLPLKIICDMLGIGEDHYGRIFEMTNIILGVGDPEYVTSIEDLMKAGSELYSTAFELAEARRAEPRDDLTTRLVDTTDLGPDEEPMTAQEYGSFFVLLVVAGNETTRNAISWGLKLLSDHPDQRALLVEDIEGRMPSAVEEIVRYSTPVIHFRRTAVTDVEIGGHRFEEGDKAVLWYSSANRDEDHFPDASRFDITREPNDHMGFGAGGPHFCLGAHLARREIRVMFEELLTWLPDIRASAEPDRLISPFIHGIKRMPCEFTPRDPAEIAPA